MGRQTGKTTIATLYILWYALFHKSKNIAVLANKAAQAEEILLRIKNAYTELPIALSLMTQITSQPSISYTNSSAIPPFPMIIILLALVSCF